MKLISRKRRLKQLRRKRNRMDKLSMACIRWRYRESKVEGGGQPVARHIAEEHVREGNIRHGSIMTHWIEEVKV